MHNDLSFKVKFQDSDLYNFESVYTEPIKPKYFPKDNTTIYSYFDDKNNYFIFDNLFFSLNELRSSNLSLILFDTKLEIDEDEEKDNDKENDIILERSSFHLKNKTSDHSTKTYLNLKKRYNQIGYAYVNFYKILSQNDNTIMKTASKVFQNFSLLYTRALYTKNKPCSNIGSTNKESNNNMLTNGNAEENKSIQKVDNIMSKEIKFQVFDDVSRAFSEKIFFKGAEIGKVNYN